MYSSGFLYTGLHGNYLADATAKMSLIDGLLLTVSFSKTGAILTEALRKATPRHREQQLENCHKRICRLDAP